MKLSTLSIVVLSFIMFIVLSSSKPKKAKIEKNYSEVSHHFYASIHEVTNIEFKEFLNDLKAKNELVDYNRFYPDTTQWRKKIQVSFSEPFVEKYFCHPGFNNYPVVNITREAAQKYCTWLSKKYNSKDKKQFKKVVFRLPTEQEWNEMASVLPGHNLPWYGNFAYEPSTDKYCANIKFENKWTTSNKYDYSADGALTTSKVGMYKANKIGLRDIIGNVSEITSSGILKGGSWDNTIEECVVNKSQNFQLPDPRVGFRVIMIIEKP